MSVLSESLKSEPVEEESELQPGFSNVPPTPPVTTWGDSNLPAALISDIDHTISFNGPSRDFNDFAKSEDDVPNEEVIALIKEWYTLTEKPTIYFVTNRDVKWRDVTTRWLVKYFPPAQYKWLIRMRPSNDLISTAWMIKEAHLVNDIAKKCSVQKVLEDDDVCIAMYRSYGLVVLDAKETWR
jgi:hypothetical protein